MTHVSLFSGIGGIDLAAHAAGFETIQFVEQNPFCQQVLAKQFPGVPIHDDIKTYFPIRTRPLTLLSGGYPCQPFSCAGQQRRTKDDRHLFPEMLRVARVLKPAYILGENVPGIVTLALDDCLTALEDIGYTCQTFNIPASSVGAIHRRKRIFIVARLSADTRCEPMPQKDARQDPIRSQWHPRDNACRIDTGTDWSLSESRLGRSIDGVSRKLDRHFIERMKALGNAVVPQQVLPILEAIAADYARITRPVSP